MTKIEEMNVIFNQDSCNKDINSEIFFRIVLDMLEIIDHSFNIENIKKHKDETTYIRLVNASHTDWSLLELYDTGEGYENLFCTIRLSLNQLEILSESLTAIIKLKQLRNKLTLD